MSGYVTCPSCQFLVAHEDDECRFCRTSLLRAAVPVAGAGVGSSLPPPPPPPPSAQMPWAQSGQPRSARKVALVVAGVAACAAIAAASLVVTDSGGPSHPAAWDPRVEELVRFVEDERGLPFKHPVHIEFLDPADFDGEVTAGSDPSDELRAEVEKYSGLYRAMGLASGELDLFASHEDLVTEGVAAFYSYETERIYISGTDLDVATSVTVVHELVHAWQDQHLGLGSISDTLDAVTHETHLAAVEGDATRIEYRYYFDALTDAERAEVDAAEAAVMNAETSDVLESLPRVLISEFAAPYVLGHPYVNLLAAWRGDTAVDEAIKNPAASSELILDPFALLDGDEPVAMQEPSLQDGEERFDGGTLGAMFLYLVLNERVGPIEALAAADGWGGDAYVAFTRDGRSCVRATVRAESPDALGRLSQAIGTWASAMPAGSVEWSAGDDIDLTSCDPGAEAAIPPPILPDVNPLLVPGARLEIASSVYSEVGDVEFTRCFVGRFMSVVTIEQLTAMGPDLEPLSASVAEGCLASG